MCLKVPIYVPEDAGYVPEIAALLPVFDVKNLFILLTGKGFKG
jgi:hypothetical protein